MLTRLPDWTMDAACEGLSTRDVDPWCPDPELPRREREYLTAKARMVCAACPVMLDCAADALASLPKVEEHAMRGAMTPAELIAVAKKLGLPYRREAQHGTRSKYTAGCHDGVDGGACEDCKRAHREYEHERRLKARSRRRTPVEFPVLVQPLGRGRRRVQPGQLILFADGLPASYTEEETHEQPAEAEPEPRGPGAVPVEGGRVESVA